MVRKTPKDLVTRIISTLETKLFDILCFKIFALSLRSRRQHEAWGVSPRRAAAKRSEPTEWATANGCRPFHGLDGAPNLTWKSSRKSSTAPDKSQSDFTSSETL